MYGICSTNTDTKSKLLVSCTVKLSKYLNVSERNILATLGFFKNYYLMNIASKTKLIYYYATLYIRAFSFMLADVTSRSHFNWNSNTGKKKALLIIYKYVVLARVVSEYVLKFLAKLASCFYKIVLTEECNIHLFCFVVI